MSRRLGLVLAVALVVRLVPILAADRVVADVLRYQKADDERRSEEHTS